MIARTVTSRQHIGLFRLHRMRSVAHRRLSRSSRKVTSGTTLRDPTALAREAMDPGVVLLSVKGRRDSSRASRRPISNLRWRGSLSVACFHNDDSVGLPPWRFSAVDIGGHGTGVCYGTEKYR